MSIFSTLYSASSSTNIRLDKRHWPLYLVNNARLNTGCTFIPGGSSSLAALHPTIYGALNGPMYWGRSFPGLSFSLRCFINKSTLSSVPLSDILHTLSTRCLSASAYLVSHSWILVSNFCKLPDSLPWQAFTLVVPQDLLAGIIYVHALSCKAFCQYASVV